MSRNQYDVIVVGARGAGSPTDLTLIVGCWPYAEFHAHRTNVESAFAAMFDTAPSFAERVAAQGNQEAMDGFARLYADAMPPAARTELVAAPSAR